MKKFQYVLGTVFMLSAASCSVENINETPVSGIQTIKMEFSAETPAPNTKTSIDPSADNAVYWTKDDAISVFPIGGGNYKFVLEDEGGSSSGTFAGEATEADTYYALYPYNASASLSGNTITSTLPSTQYSTADGTFDTMLSPVAGISSDGSNNFELQHIAGLLELNFANLDGTVKEIQLKAAESMAGDYTVSLTDGTFSAAAVQSDEAVGVHLVAKDGGPLADGPYYLVLLPGTYTDVQLFITLDDGTSYMVGTLDTFEVKAGELRPQTVDASKATANDDGLYGLFMAGADIYIGSKAYSTKDINTFGSVYHITAENASGTTFNTSGIYFIDSDASITYSQSSPALNTVVLIGNDPAKRTTINFTRYIALNNADGHFACYNIDFDGREYANYIITSNYNGNFNYIAFDNCSFEVYNQTSRNTPVINFATAAASSGGTSRGFETLVIENCIYKTYATTSNRFFVNMTATSDVENTAELGSITFNNNLVYCTDPSNGMATNFKIFNGSNNSVDNVIINNNSFINIATSTSYTVYANSINYIELQNNLYYAPTVINNVGFFRSATPVPAGLVQNNISYIQTPGQSEPNEDGNVITYGMYAYWGGNIGFEYEEIESLTETPFETPFDIATESYTLKPEYASYGAQR